MSEQANIDMFKQQAVVLQQTISRRTAVVAARADLRRGRHALEKHHQRFWDVRQRQRVCKQRCFCSNEE
jgi:hypothetical protein